MTSLLGAGAIGIIVGLLAGEWIRAYRERRKPSAIIGNVRRW